jgi:hypothetical protein
MARSPSSQLAGMGSESSPTNCLTWSWKRNASSTGWSERSWTSRPQYRESSVSRRAEAMSNGPAADHGDLGDLEVAEAGARLAQRWADLPPPEVR